MSAGKTEIVGIGDVGIILKSVATSVCLCLLASCQPRTMIGSAKPSSSQSLGILSQQALNDALELGGTAQTGAMLYLVVGATTKDEASAQILLKKALPLFGDMQSYFIVQRSDHFGGMAAGGYVVVEAYALKPSTQNLEFAKRAFPKASVVRVKVLTSDPIPVYEQLLSQ